MLRAASPDLARRARVSREQTHTPTHPHTHTPTHPHPHPHPNTHTHTHTHTQARMSVAWTFSKQSGSSTRTADSKTPVLHWRRKQHWFIHWAMRDTVQHTDLPSPSQKTSLLPPNGSPLGDEGPRDGDGPAVARRSSLRKCWPAEANRARRARASVRCTNARIVQRPCESARKPAHDCPFIGARGGSLSAGRAAGAREREREGERERERERMRERDREIERERINELAGAWGRGRGRGCRRGWGRCCR